MPCLCCIASYVFFQTCVALHPMFFRLVLLCPAAVVLRVTRSIVNILTKCIISGQLISLLSTSFNSGLSCEIPRDILTFWFTMGTRNPNDLDIEMIEVVFFPFGFIVSICSRSIYFCAGWMIQNSVVSVSFRHVIRCTGLRYFHCQLQCCSMLLQVRKFTTNPVV